MALFWSEWMISVFLISIGYQEFCISAKLQVKTVFLRQAICGTTISAGQPMKNWKRILFKPDERCYSKFTCRVTLMMKKYDSRATDLCVDFSRMELYEADTDLVFRSGDTDEFLQGLGSDRYPKIEQYMHSELCVPATKTLVLEFRANCERSLNQLFKGWMYVYVQSTITGSIHFVDGNCTNKYKTPENTQAKVTLRSHIWNGPVMDFPQHSSFRLSVGDYNQRRWICIKWNDLLHTAVQNSALVKIFKTRIPGERPLRIIANLLTPRDFQDVDMVDLNCVSLHYIEELVFEVSRNFSVTSRNEGQLLFELTASVHKEDLTVTDPPEEVKTTPALEESESGADPLKIGIGVAAAAVAICLCCCCCKLCRRSSSSSGGGSDDSGDNPNVNSTQNNVHPTVFINLEPADSYPMLPSETPTAPAWEEENQEPTGTYFGDNQTSITASASAGQGTDECPPPPAYADLFPEKDSEHGKC